MVRRQDLKGKLFYLGHKLKPEDLLHFVETDDFTNDWDDLNLPEEELAELQMQIMRAPKVAPVIRGTHGLRKMRFSPKVWSLGKSGALRVCYVHFEAYYLVLLVDVYQKSEMETLPPSAIPVFNRSIKQIESYLKSLTQR